MERIYLDHAATTPVHQDVLHEVMSAMQNSFGNPSSIHAFGREARKQLNEARRQLAKTISAKENEIIFTSGGTEADNMAILGVARGYQQKGKHLITTVIEHHAVLHTFESLEKEGYEVTYLQVNEQGRISLDELKEALRDDTILVSVMFGNNEVGTIQDIEAIGELLKNHQAFFHTDAVQAYGIVPIDLNNLHVDLLAVSSHKINGPKGIGFLFCREGISLMPVMYGGEQERKRRAGTENLPAILGFTKAAAIAQDSMDEKQELYKQFKQRMQEIFAEEGIEFSLNGSVEHSLPHVLNISFPGTNVEAMLVNMDLAGIAVSSGSACTAGSIDPSHVLVAMFGKNSDRTTNAIRFSFGLNNTLVQVEQAANETVKIVKRLTKQ
ncbi:cysteine desulfurase [Bacillus sp. AGMB 02131]|uniref:cysteine desulfurase n=1 Tax=Peribacillus faecalis TaxID=2772559 RepID=A0A927HCH6_9BACI|nr:cysteine desulfurase family protein [Peribacillus faecalis]MBD3109566.1 cysteine desulfurase [Peribacillus faecalis]